MARKLEHGFPLTSMQHHSKTATMSSPVREEYEAAFQQLLLLCCLPNPSYKAIPQHQHIRLCLRE